MRLALLAILLIVSASCSKVCDLKREAFQTLIQKGVKAREYEDKVESKLCSLEWGYHGSCCEEASSMEYLASDKDQIEQSNSESQEQLATTLESLKKFIRHIESSDVKLHQQERALFRAIAAQMKDIESMEATFKATRSDCQSALVSLRESALCAICSGRSSRYYFKNRLILDEAMCSSALGKCLPSWGLNVKVIDAMDLVKSLLTRIRDRFPQLRSLDFSSVAELEKWLKRQKISTHLSQCDYRSYTCPLKTAISICESMITFQQPTFLQVTVSVFKEESTEIKKVGDFEFKIHKKVEVRNTSKSNRKINTSKTADGSEVTETVDNQVQTMEKKEETTTSANAPESQQPLNPPTIADEWKIETKPHRRLSQISGRLLLLRNIIQRREAVVFPSTQMPPSLAPIPATQNSNEEGP